jgi:hypothetical protein
MRASAPNGTIPNVWDQPNDVFNSTDLVENWDAIDASLALPRTSNSITQAASLPAGLNNTTDRGRVVYLTAADGSFSAGSIVRWNGSAWANVRGVDVHSSLPASNNYDGRMVLLSAAAGGFAAWTLVRYLTGSWYIVNQGIEISGVYPPAGSNFAGRTAIITVSGGGFPAYSVIRYNGSTWGLVGPQPVPPGTELVYATQATDVSTTNAVSPGDTLVSFSTVTYENVKHYLEIEIPIIYHTVASGQITFLLREGGSTVGNAMAFLNSPNASSKTQARFRFPFTPTAASHTYSLTWYLVTAGTATIQATGLVPATFRIVKA